MGENYHSKLNKRYTAKLRVLEGELPYYCTQYFNAKTYTMEKQSAYAYATDFKVFFEFIRTYLDEYSDVPIRAIPASMFDTLTSHDIDAFMTYLDDYEYEGDYRHNGDNGRQRKLSSVKSLCKYLLKEGMITKNPAEAVESPKIHKKDIIVLTEEDVQKLLSVIEHETGMQQYQAKHNKKCVSRDYAIMMLFLGTGMRISELVGLDIQDITFKNNNESTAHVIRKGGNAQHVFFSDQIADALKRYLGYEKYRGLPGTRDSFEVDPELKALFVSRKKNRLTVRAVQKLIEKYSKLAFGDDADKKLHAHLFRKTYGTKLYLSSKGDIKLVADTLGHSSISTTERHYVTSSIEHLKQAAMDVIPE